MSAHLVFSLLLAWLVAQIGAVFGGFMTRNLIGVVAYAGLFGAFTFGMAVA